MKTLFLIAAAACTANGAHSQSLPVNWSSIDGGGGTSTGGAFSVRGTIGQPDAGGPFSGGAYSVTGGYWALTAPVQTHGAPVLTITPLGPGQLTVSWTPNTPGYVLQETPGLSPPIWSNSPSGAANPVNVSATPRTKFYRLSKP